MALGGTIWGPNTPQDHVHRSYMPNGFLSGTKVGSIKPKKHKWFIARDTGSIRFIACDSIQKATNGKERWGKTTLITQLAPLLLVRAISRMVVGSGL